MNKFVSIVNNVSNNLIMCYHNHRRFYTSYSYGSNDILKWVLYRDNCSNQSLDESLDKSFRYMLKEYRKCEDNYSRFLFINGLIDDERKILVRSLNNPEFDCFIKILRKIKVVDSFEDFKKRLEEPRLVKVDYVKTKCEVLINNILREVELVKEVRVYE